MSRSTGLFPLFVLASLLGLGGPAHAERIVSVDFTHAELKVTDMDGTLHLQTPVVLPKRMYYPVPVEGTVRRAVLGPTWVPTPNTHVELPGKFKAFYAPYEPGNAMGHCKVYIDFDNKDESLQFVRIHGNGQETDLGKRRSRSCIRIPDAVCSQLVVALAGHEGRVRVHFHE